MNVYDGFLKNFQGADFALDYDMSKRTTYGVGGLCDVAIFPRTTDELVEVIEYVKGKYPYCVIGGGSNVLVSDNGFRGVCIYTDRLKKMTLKGNILEAECGVKVSDAIKLSVENNLSGLEFAVGIPGTIGGIVAGNGGCFNKSVSDAVCYVRAENGVYNNKSCNFNYRQSRFLEGEIVLSAGFRLKVSEEDVIEQKMTRFISARRKCQPRGRSAGSVFLNQGYFAGKIIDKAGLKGYRIGGAFVSEKHANFIVCDGNKSSDVYRLINYVKETVYKTQGIALSEEIRYIGDF